MLKQLETIDFHGEVSGYFGDFVTYGKVDTGIGSIETDLNRQLGASASGGDSVVRVTFQRLIFNTEGRVTTAEQIHSPEIYKVFFEKLSKAVFLEAHEI